MLAIKAKNLNGNKVLNRNNIRTKVVLNQNKILASITHLSLLTVYRQSVSQAQSINQSIYLSNQSIKSMQSTIKYCEKSLGCIFESVSL